MNMMMMMMMIVVVVVMMMMMIRLSDFVNSVLRLPSMLYLSTYLLIFIQYSFNIYSRFIFILCYI
jgi:hypothetical protein